MQKNLFPYPRTAAGGSVFVLVEMGLPIADLVANVMSSLG